MLLPISFVETTACATSGPFSKRRCCRSRLWPRVKPTDWMILRLRRCCWRSRPLRRLICRRAVPCGSKGRSAPHRLARGSTPPHWLRPFNHRPEACPTTSSSAGCCRSTCSVQSPDRPRLSSPPGGACRACPAWPHRIRSRWKSCWHARPGSPRCRQASVQ